MKDVQPVCCVLSAYLCRKERQGLPIGQMEHGSFLTSLAGPAMGFKLGREAEGVEQAWDTQSCVFPRRA